MRLFVTILLGSALAVGCGDKEEGGEAESTSAAQTASADTSMPGDPEAGKAVYQRTCVACHGADGKGNGGMTGANFVDDATRLAKGNDELLKNIAEGMSGGSVVMPPQKDLLSEQEMKDALSYIRREFGGS